MMKSNLLTASLFTALAMPSSLMAEDRLIQLGDNPQYLYYLPLLLISILGLIIGKSLMQYKGPKEIGFLSITPHRPQAFYALNEQTVNMEPVVDNLADEETHVYSNLSKILLNEKNNGFLIEDKNFKNSMLVNRRRSRRTFLHNDDILDMGELTMLYIHPSQKEMKSLRTPPAQTFGVTRNQRAVGKLLKSCPTLIPADTRRKTFYLTKNLTFIGRSDTNDLITKMKNVSDRHSRIEKIAGRFKITDLNSLHGTFVNGRRIEEKFLKDGDEISFETVKYKFSESGKAR